MNYPASQRTGRLAEMSVERLFTSWGWTVGRDHIDVGYDHFVEPDQELYRGARFLVQTKGTAKSKKGRVVAPVSKARLRLYATHRLPVFIVRALASGDLFWIHAQEWCRLNSGKLSGAGDAGVVFSAEKLLSSRQSFEDYLHSILAPPESMLGSVADSIARRADYLTSIDPKFRVEVKSGPDGQESYGLSAADPVNPPASNVRFTLAGDADARERARKQLVEHFEYGVPADFEVEGLEASGSRLFDEIGMSRVTNATVSLEAPSDKRAVLSFVADDQYRVTSPVLHSSCRIHAGTKGFSLRPEAPGLMSVSAKFERLPDTTRASFSVHVNHDVLASKPLAEFHELVELRSWAEGVLVAKTALVVIKGMGGKISSKMPGDHIEELAPLLNWLDILGQAHAVARFLDSDVVLGREVEISDDEYDALRLAYRALRGERVRLTVKRVQVETTAVAPIPEDGLFVIVSSIMVQLGGRLLGEVPVKIGLQRFSQTRDGGQLTSLVATDDSETWLMFHDGPESLAEVLIEQ